MSMPWVGIPKLKPQLPLAEGAIPIPNIYMSIPSDIEDDGHRQESVFPS